MKPAFIIDNKRITDRRAIANAFNKYFTSIATKMNQSSSHGIQISIDDAKIPSFLDYLKPANLNSIYLSDCTTEEIQKIINEFEDGKSSDIPVRVIKKSAPIISPLLTEYFNILMQAGIFPNELKVGKISPIYKKETKSTWKTTGLYRRYQSLAKFSKKLFMHDYTISLPLKTFFIRTSSALGTLTQPVMPLTTRLPTLNDP